MYLAQDGKYHTINVDIPEYTAGTNISISNNTISVSGSVPSADIATKASQDASGNVIASTYQTKISSSNTLNGTYITNNSITSSKISDASTWNAKMDAPSNDGTTGQVLTKTSTGYEWDDIEATGKAIEEFSDGTKTFTSNDLDNFYRYTGTTNSTYTNGRIYYVEEATVTTDDSYVVSHKDGWTGSYSYEGLLGTYEKTSYTTTINSVSYPVYYNGTYYLFYTYASMGGSPYWMFNTTYSDTVNNPGSGYANTYSSDGVTWSGQAAFTYAYTVTHNAGGSSTTYTPKKVLINGDASSSSSSTVSFANITGNPSDNESLSAVLSAKMDAPTNSGSTGQVLTKTSTGYAWQTTETGESGTAINNLCFKAPTISADKYAKLIIDFKNDSDTTVSSINSYSNSSLFKAFNGSTFITIGVLNNNYSEKQVLVDISTLTDSATWFTYRWDGCSSTGTSNSTGEIGASRLDAASQLFDLEGSSAAVTQAELTETLTDYVLSTTLDTKLLDYVKTDNLPNGIESFTSSSKSFTSDDAGKIFKYTGTTSGKFVNGKYYGIILNNSTYVAIPISFDQVQAIEESASSTYTVYPGRNVQLTCTGNITLAADGGESGLWGSAEIDIIPGSYDVSEGTNLTFVDSPTANVTNHCIVRWRGTSARLYVVDTE